MTERLADVGAHIGNIRQLGVVVSAMRGIAAARAQQARTALPAVDRYAATIGHAIAQASALLPRAHQQAAGSDGARLGLVLFCAEQGFAGAFSERVLDAAGAELSGALLFIAGTRGGVAMAERHVAIAWQGEIPSRSAGIPKFGGRIAKALYAHLARGEIARLDVIFCRWQPGGGSHVVRRTLLPLDPAEFPAPTRGAPPLIDLAPTDLLEALTGDYVHALLCNAALHSFAAENEARMNTMAAAHTQTERRLDELVATQRRVRQEEITAEIIELAAGESASREREA